MYGIDLVVVTRRCAGGMKSKILILACGLSLMPFPTTADPLLWRDGYKDRKGNLIVADWQVFNAADGAKFAIDVKSITRIDANNNITRVIAYLIAADNFDPDNLISFTFDCNNQLFEVVSNASRDRIHPAESQAHDLACR